MLSNRTDTNRTIFIIVCSYIYNNRSKLNLLSTCKFFYEQYHLIFFYELVDASKIINPNIASRFTNIKINCFEFNYEIFTNVECLAITKCTIIRCLPPKLIKLYIYDTQTIIINNIVMPKNLKILHVMSRQPMIDNFLLDSLERLFICGPYHSNILPRNLKYLRIGPDVNSFLILNKISARITTAESVVSSKLKCLILEGNIVRQFLFDYDIPNIKLPETVKHFSLNPLNISIEQLRYIMPKYITHFEFDNIKHYDILHEYPTLTKITIRNNDHPLFNQHLQKIPKHITSISYNYEEKADFFGDFFRYLPPTVTSLSINYYRKSLMCDGKMIPSTVRKLRLCNFNNNTTIPTCIRELQIDNISVSNKIMYWQLTVKKLIIKYADRQYLDSDIYNNCDVVYKYC